MAAFTIGADPELFFRNNYKLVSVIDKLGGSKEEPLPLDIPGCAIQEDNVAAEFNIPPCNDVEAFKFHINYVLGELRKRAEAMGLSLAPNVASHSFDDEELNHWKARMFGCDPDYNAWTKKKNPPPYAEDENLRSAGGHVHIGARLDPFDLGRACDLFLGVPSTRLDPDTTRRNLYGRAGSIRPKPYGMEYRTLSNFWIWSEEHTEWVYDQTQKAVRFVEEGHKIPNLIGAHIRKAINEGDVQAYERSMKFASGF